MQSLVDSLLWAGIAGLALAFALCYWKLGYKWLRHAGTLVHEVGHAVTGVITGGKLSGIALHADSSGMTYTGHYVGARGAFSRVMTTMAGYPAPGVFAFALLSGFLFTSTPYEWAWWVMLAMSALCLVFARSFFTLIVTSFFAIIPSLFLFVLDNASVFMQSAALWFVVGVLVWSGFQGMRELSHITHHEPMRETDAYSLKVQMGMPLKLALAWFWILFAVMPVITVLVAYGVHAVISSF